MNFLIRIFVCSFLVLGLSGCELSQRIYKAERENRGGYADQLSDKVLIANNPKMRVLRGYALTAAMSGLALEFGLGEAERQAAAAQIISAMGFLNKSYKCAHDYPNCIYFDTRMFDVNKSMLSLAKTILPVKEFRGLVRGSKLGISTIRGLLSLSGRAIKGALRVGAIYRDTWHLYTLVYVNHLDKNKSVGTLDQKAKIKKAIDEIKEIHFHGAGNIGKWKNLIHNIDKMHPEFIEFANTIIPEPKHFLSVIEEISDNCELLAQEAIKPLCAVEKLSKDTDLISSS